MTDLPFGRLSEALSDRYDLERELGSGGMATVYLATDVKHSRPVAVKVLHPELAAVVGADRFLAEIETTANLQHPHILPLFDSGEADGFLFYVMPFVKGESLRERLDRERQLPVDQAVDIARKVASALQNAHEKGVVHRDIKPANILLSQGEPLVADFGIALAVTSAGSGRITETGLSLGTPHYMSPEQASGDRSLDPRSDVYALGCVLYEMLTGEPPFPGPTPQAVLARILTSAPQRTVATRHTVPPHVDAAVAKSLEKLPADRFDSVAAFRRALEDPDFRHVGPRAAVGREERRAATGTGSPGARQARWALAGAGAVLAVAALWGWLRPADPAPPFRRVTTVLEDAGADFGPSVALSPDGERIAYQTEEGEIRIRSLVSNQVRTLDGGGATLRTPFFSPDGNAVAYHAGAPGRSEIRWTSLVGGNSMVVAAGAFPGGAWSEDGWIYHTRGLDGSFWRARPEGGEPERPPQPDSGSFAWPQVLPGGERILVFFEDQASAADPVLSLYDPREGTAQPIDGPALQDAWYARYAGGHLFWISGNFTLLAAPLDVEEARLTGSPIALSPNVQVTGQGGHFAVADDGTLLALVGTSTEAGEGENLAWVSREGSMEIVDGRLGEQLNDLDEVELSPDGRYVALQVEPTEGEPGGAHIWIYDLREATLYPLTFDGRNADPKWLGDGRVAYQSTRDGREVIRAQPFDRSGSEELLLDPGREINEYDPTRPGQPMILSLRTETASAEGGSENAWSLYLAERGDDASLRPFLDTRFREDEPAVSPDGRWVAYASTESGRPEIYVRAFPEGGRPWPISREGGHSPHWSRDGGELFYVMPERGRLRVARMEFSEGVRVEETSDLFSVIPYEMSGFDVSLDGERLLTIAEPNRGALGEAVLLLNVFGELERRRAR